jgi:hypothetical protein
MCHLDCVSSPALGLKGMRTENVVNAGHIPLTIHRAVVCTLLMAGGIVKEKQALGPSLCETLENVNCTVDLSEQVHGREPAIPVLPWLEEDVCFTVGKR